MEAAGKTFYIVVVPLGGDAGFPEQWVAAGMADILEAGSVSADACAVIDAGGFALGDPVSLAGGVYNITMFVDLNNSGPFQDDGDVSWVPTHILTGDTVYYWSYPVSDGEF